MSATGDAELGHKLRKRRLEGDHGLKQPAHFAGIKPSTLSDYEKGRSTPGVVVLKKLWRTSTASAWTGCSATSLEGIRLPREVGLYVPTVKPAPSGAQSSSKPVPRPGKMGAWTHQLHQDE